MPDRCVTGSVILIHDRERFFFTNKAINSRFSVVGNRVECYDYISGSEIVLPYYALTAHYFAM